MTKVLIAESVDINVLEEFKSKTHIQFDYFPDISPQELETKISGYNGLIVRPKPVSVDAIQNADALKIIIRGGAGVNSIALDECKNCGIIVANTPGLNSDATAEFTFATLLQLMRNGQIARSDKLTREGNPGAPEDYSGNELKGKKIGLIGAGNIAKRVARIAEAFGMEVSIFVRTQKDLPYPQFINLHEFLKQQHDVISLHVPLTPETNFMLKDDEFALMKKGVIIINTARPQLICVKAMTKALAREIVRGFAIDGDYDLVAPFTRIDKKNKGIITHHIADCTIEAQANITRQALVQMVAFFEKNEVINRVI